jgi:hypothetical protein
MYLPYSFLLISNKFCNGPQIALDYLLDVISQGPENSQFPGPNPLPLAFVMNMHASKTFCRGLY